jgi:hypothetical protein
MSNDLERVMDAEQERLSHLPSDQLPVLPAGVQTRLSWARKIDALTALPPIYQDFMTALLGDGHPFPYAVITPTFAGFMRREKEKLVFCLDDQLHIVERDGSRLVPLRYPLADLNCVEVGSILLKAWITVSGLTSEGALTSTTLRFNAVVDRLFAPFLERVRASGDPTAGVDRDAELRKFDYLTTMNYKFRNFAYRSVGPAQRVIDSLLQPEMRAPLFTFFGKTLSRLVSTAHLWILTDTELITIRDDEDSPIWQDGSRYGGVWLYLPLSKIATISVTNRAADVLAVQLKLPHGDRVESLFVADRRAEVEQFLYQVSEWAPGAALERA